MAEKLSITIFLDGAAEIERQLEGIGQAGTKAFDAIGTAAEKAGGFEKLDPKDVTAKLEQFGVKGKAAIDKITAAVAQAGRLERIVGGVRQVEQGFASVGVAATAMSTKIATEFAAAEAAIGRFIPPLTQVRSLFRAIGLPLTIGGIGAAAVGMERLADAARILEGNLQAVFRSASAGTQFFNQIQQSAQSAGASLESTGKAMLEIVKVIQSGLAARGVRFLPGAEGLKQITADAQQLFDTLQKGMQLSGARADEATKDIKALFAEISKNQEKPGDTFAQISQKAKGMADVLRKLGAEFPQLANELVKVLGTPGQSMEQLADQVERGIRKIDVPKFINAVKRITPEIEKMRDAFDPTLGQRMDSISGAWDRLINSFGKSPAAAGIKAAMDDIAKGLDEFAKSLAQAAGKTQFATFTGAFLDEVRKTIETTKKEWNALVKVFTDPISFDEALTQIEQFIIKIGDKINTLLLPKKITVPFEADPEPPWVQAYLGFIEKVKSAFKEIFKTDTAEGQPQQPAWVESYLGWIEKVKRAFENMFTKSPEIGGSVPGGVPLIGDLADRLPRELQDIGARRIEDRRSELQPVFDNIKQMAAETFAAVAAASAAAFGQVKTDVSAVGSAAVQSFGQVTTAAQTMAPAITPANESIRTLSSNLEQASTSAKQMASDFSQVKNFVPGNAAIVMNDVKSAIDGAENELRSLLSTASGLSNVADVTGAIVNAMQQLQGAARAAADAIASVSAAGGMATGGFVGGFQSGGRVGGRGTGTSDSNLAWVSRGEYIVPAQAVRAPGVLAFLEALRRSGGSLRDVLDDMGRFALGGLVPRSIPAFASGGLAGGGMSNVTIQFPGMPEISGLRAPAKVVEELRKTAALAQVRSGGRKPSRYS